MILGILAQQFGRGGGGGGGDPVAARYWRLYFTGNDRAVRFMASGDVEMAETLGGINVIGAGTPSASTERGSFYRATDAFNGDNGTWWESLSDNQLPSWLAYDFGGSVEVDINEITIFSPEFDGEEVNMFASALVQSSDNGSDWITRWVIPVQDAWTFDEDRTFDSAGGLPALFVSDTRRENQTSASSTTTFAGMFFGPERADRLVAVAVTSHWSSTNDITPISSMTIGGAAATRAVRSKDAANADQSVEIWYARPSGEAGDVVITHGASETRWIRATAWNIGGVGDATPESTDRYGAGAAGDLSIAAPSGSVVIAVPCGFFSSVTLSGLDETFFHNLTNTGFNGLAQEHVVTGATKTITASATGARVAACWAI